MSRILDFCLLSAWFIYDALALFREHINDVGTGHGGKCSASVTMVSWGATQSFCSLPRHSSARAAAAVRFSTPSFS